MHMYVLVGKPKPEYVVGVENGRVDGREEENIADVKLDSSLVIVSLKQDWI